MIYIWNFGILLLEVLLAFNKLTCLINMVKGRLKLNFAGHDHFRMIYLFEISVIFHNPPKNEMRKKNLLKFFDHKSAPTTNLLKYFLIRFCWNTQNWIARISSLILLKMNKTIRSYDSLRKKWIPVFWSFKKSRK